MALLFRPFCQPPASNHPVHGSALAAPHASAPHAAPRGVAPAAWRCAARRRRGPPPAPAAAAPATMEEVFGGWLREEAPLYRSPPRPASEFGFNKKFEQLFELGEKIGSGCQGVVHLATCRRTGETLAVKVMPKQFCDDGLLDSHFVRKVRNEVDIHAHLGRSLNVCYMYDAFENDEAVMLVLEHCSGGALWDRIQRGQYTERQAARVIQDILRLVALCHSKHIMLRDIKPHNFLFASLDENAPLKAVDFGISVFVKPDQYITQRAGTRVCMAPEVVEQDYSLPADLWSTGILAYLLLTGRLPFKKEMYKGSNVQAQDIFHDILHAPLDFDSPPWDSLSPDAKDFVQSLLHRDPSQRVTAKQALQHRWLREEVHKGDKPLADSIVQRLQRFGTYGRLKQAALHTVANSIAHDSMLLQDLKALFRELDPADTGRVPFQALLRELEEGSFILTPREAHQLLLQMHADPDGDITFDKFVASLMDWSKLHDTPEWDEIVERAFETLDADHSGRIGLKDLELLLCGEGGCEAPDVLHAALREAELSPKGGITLLEFRRFLAAQLQDGLDLFDPRLGLPEAGYFADSEVDYSSDEYI